MALVYPTRSDYVSSIKNPEFAFKKKDVVTKVDKALDKSLVLGQPVKYRNSAGQEIVWLASGNFACVFKYKTFLPNQIWAIRCFLKSTSNVIEHYERISKYIKRISCKSYFVDFSLIKEGIRVNGVLYPVLKMEWIDGQNIKDTVKCYLGNRKKLRELARVWLKLAQDLHNDRVAHGDLQHGNILVIENKGFNLKLIDYDSLYFERYSGKRQDEIKGLPGYQHPSRHHLVTQCIETDYFSSIVIYLSILTLAEHPELWQLCSVENSERLLFSESDLTKPDNSELFKVLANSSLEVSNLALKLKSFCNLTDITKIPSLPEILGDEIVSNTFEVNLKESRLSNPSPVSWIPNKSYSTVIQQEHFRGSTLFPSSSESLYESIEKRQEPGPQESSQNISAKSYKCKTISTSSKNSKNIFMLFTGSVFSLAAVASAVFAFSDLNKLKNIETFIEKSNSFRNSENYSACISMAKDALEIYNQTFLIKRAKTQKEAIDFRDDCQLSKDNQYLVNAGKFIEQDLYLDTIREAQKVTSFDERVYSMAQDLIGDSVDAITNFAEKKYDEGNLEAAIEEMIPLVDILLVKSDFYQQANDTIDGWEKAWNQNTKKLEEAQAKVKDCRDLSEVRSLAQSLTTAFYRAKADQILFNAKECDYKALLASARSHYDNGALKKAIETVNNIPGDSKFYNEAGELRNRWQGEYNKAKSDLENFLNQYFNLINTKDFEIALSNYLTDNFRKSVVTGNSRSEQLFNYRKHWDSVFVQLKNINLIKVKSNYVMAEVSIERREISTSSVSPKTRTWCFMKTSSSFFKFETKNFCE